jgi:hypothetical protein
MLVKYKSNGVQEHVQNQIGRALVNSGLAEEVPAAPGKSIWDREREKIHAEIAAGKKLDTTPRFSVVKVDSKDEYGRDKTVLAVRCDYGMHNNHTVYHYMGKPLLLNAKIAHGGVERYFSGFGCETPKEICEVYERQWRAHPEMRLPKDILDPPKETPSGCTTTAKHVSDLKYEAACAAIGMTPHYVDGVPEMPFSGAKKG